MKKKLNDLQCEIRKIVGSMPPSIWMRWNKTWKT